MTWNYRVVKTKYKTGEVSWAIHECFYHEEDVSQPHSHTADPVAPIVFDHTDIDETAMTDKEALKDLRISLERMLRALDQPIVDNLE